MSGRLFARDALLPGGWATDVLLQWDANGRFVDITPGATKPVGVSTAQGPVIAGIPNLHSHAFQRAFAGLAEFRGTPADSFWSWRSLMYRVALKVTPDQLEAIATWLFVEMLEGGFTSVCEFHYLHHDTDGRPYADDATLARCVVRAAARTGIGLTLLPVLYQTSGFGGVAPEADQRRFVRSTASLLRLLSTLAPVCEAEGTRLGLALHSLRAVPPDSLRDALAGIDALDPTAPIHIHIAEQTKEVEDCLAWSGQRPVGWLLAHVDVDERWCLVHATHLTADESRAAARAGAVAGLCPTTEANLGDGIFDFPIWRSAAPVGGHWGVGSDSHVCVNAAQELQMLEYGQRLQRRQRNITATGEEPQVATALVGGAVAGGARAAGHLSRGNAGLVVGGRADFVVLDGDHPLIAGLPAAEMLAAHVFASHRASAIATVTVMGSTRVAGGRHPLHDEAAAAFVAARAALLTTLSP